MQAISFPQQRTIFKVYYNITSIPRVDPSYTHAEPIITFPRFPLKPPAEQIVIPGQIYEAEKTLLERLQVDEEKINDIESKTRGQADSEEWRNERKF